MGPVNAEELAAAYVSTPDWRCCMHAHLPGSTIQHESPPLVGHVRKTVSTSAAIEYLGASTGRAVRGNYLESCRVCTFATRSAAAAMARVFAEHAATCHMVPVLIEQSERVSAVELRVLSKVLRGSHDAHPSSRLDLVRPSVQAYAAPDEKISTPASW